MCTKPELEDSKCTAFTGCGFDTSLVWSSSEANPEACPVTSYSSGGDFVTAFDSLYNGRNTSIFPAPNPMRIKKDQAVKKDFSNVQFPTAYYNKVSLSGITKFCASETENVYLGCWKDPNEVTDPVSPRALPNKLDDNYTIQDCIEACNSKGYIYAGLQWKSECYCGGENDDYTKYGLATGCNCCEGENHGGNKNCVYGPGALASSASSTVCELGRKSEEGSIEDVCKSIYLYDYENILSNIEDLYCDAKLGPPSALAQAIDESMTLLLGNRVSIGLLKSTSIAVNNCK